MIQHPLTNLQAWGLEDEEMPAPEKKDFFDYETQEKDKEDETESEAGSGDRGGL